MPEQFCKRQERPNQLWKGCDSNGKVGSVRKFKISSSAQKILIFRKYTIVYLQERGEYESNKTGVRLKRSVTRTSVAQLFLKPLLLNIQ
jgi:hypothetical protein